MSKMRAAVYTGPQRFEVQQVDAPEAQPGGVLVRVRNCGICGSDLHFYKGEFPSAPGMRMGHEISGEVAALGEGVSGLAVGQPIAIEPVEVCRRCAYCQSGRQQLCPERKFHGTMLPGAFAEYIQVPSYIVHPLPDGMPFDAGALVEPLAVTVHGLRQAGLEAGERVAIIGAGTIGLMATVAAKAMGASEVYVTARYPHQAEAARAFGATVVDAGEGSVVKLTELFAGRFPEMVVETVGGNGETLNQAIALAQAGGRISVLGIFTGQASINMTVAVLKEVALLGGIVYGRPKSQSDFELALAIAGEHWQAMRQVITHRVALDEIQRGFEIAADKSQRSIKVTVEV